MNAKTATRKAVTLTVSISTNPAVSGRYFTSMTDNRTDNRMRTTTNDRAETLDFIASVEGMAGPLGIEVVLVDLTGELNL